MSAASASGGWAELSDVMSRQQEGPFPNPRRIPARVWLFVPFQSSFLILALPFPPQRLRGPKHPKNGQEKAPGGVTVFNVSNVTVPEAVRTV